MKLIEKKPEIVYRIIGPGGETCSVYSMAAHSETDFRSPQEARRANVHGVYLDPKYKIAKYRVTYTLLEEDAQGGTD